MKHATVGYAGRSRLAISATTIWTVSLIFARANFGNQRRLLNNSGVSTGVLFGLSSRLARYTGNETYADWADKTWTWLEGINLIDTDVYAIFDGTYADENCTDINKAEFSYVNGIYTLGCAHMYNLVSLGAQYSLVNDQRFEQLPNTLTFLDKR